MLGNLSSHDLLFLSRLSIGVGSIGIGIGIADADNQIGDANRSFVPRCSQPAYQHVTVMEQCPLRGLQLQHLDYVPSSRYGPLPFIFDPHRTTGPTCLWLFRFAVTDARPKS